MFKRNFGMFFFQWMSHTKIVLNHNMPAIKLFGTYVTGHDSKWNDKLKLHGPRRPHAIQVTFPNSPDYDQSVAVTVRDPVCSF